MYLKTNLKHNKQLQKEVTEIRRNEEQQEPGSSNLIGWKFEVGVAA